jgi:uncharacterized phiE125 gp8 family phage protein
MPLVSYALTSLATVKEYLNITVGSEDNLLERLINSCTDFIESYCGRRFKIEVYVSEKYDGNSEKKLYLKNYPIILVSELKIDNIVIALADFKIYNNEGSLYYTAGFNKEMQNILVSYQAGYSTIPYDLEQACIKLVAGIYQSRGGTAATGVKSENIGDYSVSYFGGSEGAISITNIPWDVEKTLIKYKKDII